MTGIVYRCNGRLYLSAYDHIMPRAPETIGTQKLNGIEPS
jgi:hypothetical protein